MNRWWIYQKERFPVVAHGLLIASFSSSAVCFSALLGGRAAFPAWQSFLAAFVTSFIFFLQLRIADEFKDIEEDTRYRPYRPVPRGLVTLRELGVVFLLGAVLQLGVALWLDPKLVPVLVIAWIYLALMSREFFAREWLTARPITYLWTHMLIMPLVDLYATATEWVPLGKSVPAGLMFFLVVSFFNGVVIEIGRKIRIVEDEEKGVPTYTRLWGQKGAPLVWIGAVFVTALTAGFAGFLIDFGWTTFAILTVLVSLAVWLVLAFLRQPDSKTAKRFETFSGIWTLAMYLTLGLIPMILKTYG